MVRLVFALPEARRLFLIVRGPAPSCEVAGVILVRGDKGRNRVNFAGRAGGKTLRPGGYVLSLSPSRKPTKEGPTTFVEVVSKRRSVPAREGSPRPSCAASRAGYTSRATPLPPRDGDRRAAASRDATASAPVLADDDEHAILGVAIPEVQFDPRDSGTWLAALVTIGILTFVGAILLSTITLVLRFVRGTWNP